MLQVGRGDMPVHQDGLVDGMSELLGPEAGWFGEKGKEKMGDLSSLGNPAENHRPPFRFAARATVAAVLSEKSFHCVCCPACRESGESGLRCCHEH